MKESPRTALPLVARRRILRLVEEWQQARLIDAATAAALREDVVRRRAAFPAARLLALFAALTLGAALLLLIAANWDVLPRLWRVALLALTMFAANLGGAWAALRARPVLAEGLYLAGGFAFGASLALVGQMYHLSGDTADALAIWYVSTLVSSLVLRAAWLNAGAVVLALCWIGTRAADAPLSLAASHVFLAMIAASFALSYRTRSLPARHLSALALAAYTLSLFAWADSPLAAALLAVLFAAGLAAARFLRARAPPALAVHCLLQFLFAMVLLQLDMEGGWALAVCATATFAVLGGTAATLDADERALRGLIYVAFVLELVWLYVTLIGTMLGTAGYLLLVGTALALAAWIVARRQQARPAREDAR